MGVTVGVSSAPLARRGRAGPSSLLLAVLAATAGLMGVEIGGTPARSSAVVSAKLRGLPRVRTATRCTSRMLASPGAAERFGLDAVGVPDPLWSGAVGDVQGIAGDRIVTTTGDDCVGAIDASSGRTLWVDALRVRGSAGTEGLTAGTRVVVVGLSRTIGRSPGRVYGVVDGLVGLDPANGRHLWKLELGPDGQELPAVVEGPTVVVSKPDGVVEGVRASSGAVSWSDPLLPHCRRPSTMGPLEPRASIMSGGASAIVLYRCGLREVVASISPRTGRRDWTWRASGSVLWQAREVIGPTTPSAVGDGVVAIGEASVGALGAPSKAWDLGLSTTQGYDLVVLARQTGRPLWVLRDVPTPATGAEPDVAVGGGNICVGHAAAVECRSAKTGALVWRWSAPERSSPLLVDRMPGLALAGDELFLAAPTPASAKIDPESTTQRSDPGTFRLMGFDVTDGKVEDAQGLPAYYGGSNGVVVSDTNPPDVRAALHGVVVLTPGPGSGVVEAFRQ